MIKEPLLQIGLLLLIVFVLYQVTLNWYKKGTSQTPYGFWNYDDGLPTVWKPSRENMKPVVLSGATYREGYENVEEEFEEGQEFEGYEEVEEGFDGEYEGFEGFEEEVEGLENIEFPTDDATMRQNYLNATGVDRIGSVTVQTPKRYLSNDLRKAVANPRMTKVLWNQSTAEADPYRRSLESIE